MKNSSKWFWGLFFIAGGAAIIVNQLGYFTEISLFSMVFTIFLAAVFIKSTIHLNFFGMLFTIAALCIIYSEPLGLDSITPWPVLITAMLGSVGLSILFHKPGKYIRFHNHHNPNNFGEVINGADENIVDFGVTFGSSTKYVNSDNLEKANFSCSFGALAVYLDTAKVSKNGAVINIDASFSGVELYIPKSWNVTNSINATLSGVEERNRRYETTGPTVTLTGNAQFSGIEIIYI